MAITADNARQYPLVAKIDFVETDLPAASTAYAAMTLPPNAIVTGGYLAVTTAFDGGADVTLAVSGGGCSLSATDADTGTSHNALTLTGVKQDTGDTVDVTLGGTIGGTAGIAHLVIEYIIDNRESEVQDD